MGLLDDAIREHLELKRRHGADADEVARQEHEALGAATAARGSASAPAEAEADVPVDAPADDEVAAVAAPEDVTRIVEPDEVAPPDDVPDSGPEAPAGELEIPEAPTQEHELPAGEPGIPEVPQREAAAPGYDEDPWLEEDDVPEEQAAAQEEDVLEETPEFLQETPEHDRLWFEQRPPRDFDWDK